jgi:HPt (histidine-containing phosphotransfer) domain-containing protein
MDLQPDDQVLDEGRVRGLIKLLGLAALRDLADEERDEMKSRVRLLSSGGPLGASAAHWIKGTASNFGLARLARLAKRLEIGIREGESIEETLGQLSACCDSSWSHWSHFLDQAGDANAAA